jgi:transcriptional regulator with XRE-family HTH domain
VTIGLEIGARIKARRRVLNWSQAKLGRAVGVREQQIHRYEAGENNITVTRLVRVAAALGVHVEDLIGAPPPEEHLQIPAQQRRLAGRQPSSDRDALPAQCVDVVVALGRIPRADVRKHLVELVQRIAGQ